MSIFSKDRVDYLKENLLTMDDQSDFERNQYFYNRESNSYNDTLQQQQQMQNGINLGNYGQMQNLGQQRQISQHQQLAGIGRGPVGQQSLSGGMSMQDSLGFGNSLIQGTSRTSGLYNGQQGDLGSSAAIGRSRIVSNGNGNTFDNSNFPMLSGSNNSRGYSAITQLGGSGGSVAQIRGLGGEDFALENEEFPALPGSQLSKSGGSVGGDVSSGGFNSLSNNLSAQQQDPFGSSSNGSSLLNVSNSFGMIGMGGNNSTGNSLQQSRGMNNFGSSLLNSSSSAVAPGSSNNSQSDFNLVGGQQNMLGSVGMGNIGGLLGNASQQQTGSSLLSSLNSSSTALNPTPVAVSKEFKFGLGGLIDILRQADKDIAVLAMGTDLTSFGLNLNSTENLFPSFSSPFSDRVVSPDPQFTTPACYMMHPPSLKTEHLSKFQLETLFYMFYCMPKDILQACAAQELYRRDWRFHSELRLWLKPRTQAELMQSHPNIQFVYFESTAWETRLFTAAAIPPGSRVSGGNITAGLLTEEDVRIKVPQPQSGGSGVGIPAGVGAG